MIEQRIGSEGWLHRLRGWIHRLGYRPERRYMRGGRTA